MREDDSKYNTSKFQEFDDQGPGEDNQDKNNLLIEDEEEKKGDDSSDEELVTRTGLPHKKDPNDRPSLFKLLKDSVGGSGNITRMVLPVYMSEPITLIQRASE